MYISVDKCAPCHELLPLDVNGPIRSIAHAYGRGVGGDDDDDAGVGGDNLQICRLGTTVGVRSPGQSLNASPSGPLHASIPPLPARTYSPSEG
jgi:hypothetical protein